MLILTPKSIALLSRRRGYLLNYIGIAGNAGFGVGIYGPTTLEPVIYNDIGIAGTIGFGIGAYGTTTLTES